MQLGSGKFWTHQTSPSTPADGLVWRIVLQKLQTHPKGLQSLNYWPIAKQIISPMSGQYVMQNTMTRTHFLSMRLYCRYIFNLFLMSSNLPSMLWQCENTLFRISRIHLAVGSHFFTVSFGIPGIKVDGRSDISPIHIPGVTASEFSTYLKLIDPRR